ncbi:MAG: hypothetical protein A2X25_14405 [Chloroflexi bacterium GWB2_49_20]|nr:MAG: hypothetical protein A2X25_14405 [Chloroflexi bacterium GWB2_49_20]OGN79839.1 MAG: hypothetical protein A2X26_02345 [Chloroflexi bacterium GWC2_49_37]OGN85626.1 MAG: hypothetical protein A2X27_04715 [Chloroflexi bacterium GWD2_49_16]HBG74506.1 hypothetical protein [Anaerolineae bacterium]HCC79620.1 hypothetical protein [Anaerolineae bacterium]
MIKEIIISTISDLLNHIGSLGPFSMYRGQANSTWKLIPSIGRLDNIRMSVFGWHIFEEELLEKFKKYSIPHLSTEPKNDVDWLVIGQHHGLPTRLLDWTTNPLKALFFSLDDNYNDGSLLAFDNTIWFENLDSLDNISSLSAFYPRHINNRLIAQEGCFTIHSFPIHNNDTGKVPPLVPIEDANFKEAGIENFVKFIINKNDKGRFKRDLDMLGINYRSLFPDLDGLTMYIKWQNKNDV